jgi:glycogen synthase
MKVLMFGWEFPPHISGGLGTACFGLSQSLIQENVDLIFVVPRADGSSTAVKLIDARDVFIPEAGKPRKIIDVPARKIKTKRFTVEEPSRVKVSEGVISLISVDANLDPYAVASVDKRQPIQQWNYEFQPPVRNEVTERIIADETRQVEIVEGYHYNFSGGYGEGLATEVHQYSLVGGELAKQFSHDVIHAHDWMTFGAGIEAKNVSGKPLVIHVHATEYDRSGCLHGPVYEIEKRGMDIADKVVTVSQWTKGHRSWEIWRGSIESGSGAQWDYRRR